jgi:Zn-dependent peptidase ImmA (M78 family)
MNLRKSVIIAGHTIKIIYKKKIVYNGGVAWGLYDDDKHIIYLTMGMEKTRKMEVFLHECIHAIEHIHGLNLSEKDVNLLGIELFAFMRNNKININ